jgi:SAM-dependent methyltransferase
MDWGPEAMTIDYAAHLQITNAPDAAMDLAVGKQRVRFLAGAGVGDDASILEIGPGHGGFLRALTVDGYRNIQAIEADHTLAQRAESVGLPVTWCPAGDTISFLESRKGQFNAICCAHVLEHVEKSQQIAFLNAIREALAPGGVIMCEVPNATSPVASLHRYWDWTHQCLFSWSSLHFVLQTAGFSQIEVHPVSNAAPPRNPMAAILIAMIRKLSHGAYRIHLLAELGRRGLNVPVTPAIIALGRRAP